MAQEITGSNPVARPNTSYTLPAPVAQRIEYWASDPGVVGSNPARRAKTRHKKRPSECSGGLIFWFCCHFAANVFLPCRRYHVLISPAESFIKAAGRSLLQPRQDMGICI